MRAVEQSVEPWELDHLAEHIGNEVPTQLNKRNRNPKLRHFSLSGEDQNISAVNLSVPGTVEEENQHQKIENQVQTVVKKMARTTESGLTRHVYMVEEVHTGCHANNHMEDGEGHHETKMHSYGLAEYLQLELAT